MKLLCSKCRKKKPLDEFSAHNKSDCMVCLLAIQTVRRMKGKPPATFKQASALKQVELIEKLNGPRQRTVFTWLEIFTKQCGYKARQIGTEAMTGKPHNIMECVGCGTRQDDPKHRKGCFVGGSESILEKKRANGFV